MDPKTDPKNDPAPKDPEPKEPPAGDPADPEPKEPTGAKGQPNWQMAAEGYRAERDAYKQQVADLTAQNEQLKQSLEGMRSAEDVQAAVDSALTEANGRFEADKAKWAEREKGLLVANALAEAGCIDATAAAAHVDLSQVTVGEDGKVEGLDMGQMRDSYPYLFGKRQQSGSTGAKPAGAPDGDAALESARASFGL